LSKILKESQKDVANENSLNAKINEEIVIVRLKNEILKIIHFLVALT
jgi:hypothetical protein